MLKRKSVKIKKEVIFPKCTKCWDKGYSTELIGGQFCLADFIGDKTYRTKGPGIIVKLCDCGRGKDLVIFFNLKKQFKI